MKMTIPPNKTAVFLLALAACVLGFIWLVYEPWADGPGERALEALYRQIGSPPGATALQQGPGIVYAGLVSKGLGNYRVTYDYQTTLSPSAIQEYYDKALRSRGWYALGTVRPTDDPTTQVSTYSNGQLQAQLDMFAPDSGLVANYSFEIDHPPSTG